MVGLGLERARVLFLIEQRLKGTVTPCVLCFVVFACWSTSSRRLDSVVPWLRSFPFAPFCPHLWYPLCHHVLYLQTTDECAVLYPGIVVSACTNLRRARSTHNACGYR